MKIWLCHLAITLLLCTSSAFAQSQRNLVEEGRRIFFEEDFDGNGRTCGTCHPAEHNFTIDAEFIATLDDNDPLFVHENDPENLGDLEDSFLLREFGLILENVDGPDSHVFRGVPHNVGMSVSINADPAHLGPTRHAVGWSGDGAPGDGTIADFLEGAIRQHFPQTLDRIEGDDFRLPEPDEVAAVEAFLRSLGRQEELDIEAMQFADQNVDAGRRLFLGDDGVNRGCNGCHGNAGANNSAGFNRNFDTGTRTLSQDPGLFGANTLPPDGGFGTEAHGDGGFGDGTFNVPSLVEAADTPPFFHNNSAETIEDAVAHYTTSTFGNSPAGGGPEEPDPFQLTREQINQVAAFLRAINAQENVRTGNVLSAQAQRLRGDEATDRIREVIAESEDAIEVLEGAATGRFQPTVPQLRAALGHERRALSSRNDAQRNRSLQQAQDMKTRAIEALLSRRVASR